MKGVCVCEWGVGFKRNIIVLCISVKQLIITQSNNKKDKNSPAPTHTHTHWHNSIGEYKTI